MHDQRHGPNGNRYYVRRVEREPFPFWPWLLFLGAVAAGGLVWWGWRH